MSEMFSPYQLPLLICYFDGIDAAVSKRLARNVPPDETALTQEFCALMDADNQRRERPLTFDVDALQKALVEPGDMLDIEFTIAAHQHGQRLEAFVSQADFGLILEYRNTVLPEMNSTKAYLMQAKRLFPDKIGGYSVASTFLSKSAPQQERMEHLAEILGEEALRYWLYMPQTTNYEPRSIGAIRALHSRNLNREIFDFSFGLALHSAIARSGGIDGGMWIADLSSSFKTAADVHNGAFETALPFTWFILAHFNHGRHSRRRYTATVSEERVSKIAVGDSKACQDLIDELGEKARDREFDPETMTVLPGSSITIRVTAGC